MLDYNVLPDNFNDVELPQGDLKLPQPAPPYHLGNHPACGGYGGRGGRGMYRSLRHRNRMRGFGAGNGALSILCMVAEAERDCAWQHVHIWAKPLEPIAKHPRNRWRCGNGHVLQAPTPGIQCEPSRESEPGLPNNCMEMAREVRERTAELLDVMDVAVQVVTNLRTRCIAIGERIEVETSQLIDCISGLTPVELVQRFREENNTGLEPETKLANSATGTISILSDTDVPLSVEEVLERINVLINVAEPMEVEETEESVLMANWFRAIRQFQPGTALTHSAGTGGLSASSGVQCNSRDGGATSLVSPGPSKTGLSIQFQELRFSLPASFGNPDTKMSDQGGIKLQQALVAQGVQPGTVGKE
ncbi:hypothetical protein FRC07_006417, partial [Ceratobasidium sp. 392]